MPSFDIIAACLGVILTISLTGAYIFYIHPAFDYYGYTYRAPESSGFVLSLALIAIVSGTLPKQLSTPSAAVLWILHVFVCIPTIVAVHLMGRIPPSTSLAVSGLVASVFLGMSWMLRQVSESNVIVETGAHRSARNQLLRDMLPKGDMSRSLLAVIFAWSCMVYVLLGLTLGLSLNFVSLLDVYDVREVQAGRVAGVPLLAYLIAWQANVLNPFLIVTGTLRRNWPVLGFGLAGQVLLYGQTGHKSVLYSVPILLLALWFLRGSRVRSARIIPALAIITVIGSLLIDELSGTILASSLIVRRAFVTPGVLTSLYIEFFSVNPHTLLSQSILEGFSDYPYNATIPAMIGSYWTEYAPSANANWIADSFANFGWMGVISFTFVLCLILKLLDAFATDLPKDISVTLVLLPAITLSNTALLTALLTHGILLLICVFILLSGDPRYSSAERRRSHAQ